MSQNAFLNENLILKWKWEFGRPVELYTEVQTAFFHEKIKEMNLTPLDIEIEVPRTMTAMDMPQKEFINRAGEALLFKRIKFPGGIIGPHFHLEGKIYLCDAKQWHKLTKDIVHVVQERLGQVGNIGMEQFSKINETLSSL